MNLDHLTNRYLLDLMDWRGGNPDGKLPEEYWFDVDMSNEFWYNHVSGYIDEETDERGALNFFLMDYVDKVYMHDLMGARIRSISEIRDENIDDLFE